MQDWALLRRCLSAGRKACAANCGAPWMLVLFIRQKNALSRTVGGQYPSMTTNIPRLYPPLLLKVPMMVCEHCLCMPLFCESLWAGRWSIVLGRRRASMGPKFKADFWDGHVKHRAEIGFVWICLMYPMTSQYII